MDIVLNEPAGPYGCTIDSGVMEVTAREVYQGLTLETDDSVKLVVWMRDDGFELRYFRKEEDEIVGFDISFELKGGHLHNVKVGNG